MMKDDESVAWALHGGPDFENNEQPSAELRFPIYFNCLSHHPERVPLTFPNPHLGPLAKVIQFEQGFSEL